MKIIHRLVIGLIAAAAFNGHTVHAQQAPTAAQASTVPLRIEKGTPFALDLETPLNSATSVEGSLVVFRTRNNIMTGGQIAIPLGTAIEGSVVKVKPAFVNGKSRRAELLVRVERVRLAGVTGGQTMRLEADVLELSVEDLGGAPGIKEVAQGSFSMALPSALLGAVLGGGRTGGAIGAVAGMGVGAISTLHKPRTKGSEIDLPAGSIFETKLTHRLDIRPGTQFANGAAPASSQPLPLPSSATLETPEASRSKTPFPSPIDAGPLYGAGPATPIASIAMMASMLNTFAPTFDDDSIESSPTLQADPSLHADLHSTLSPDFQLSVNVGLVLVDAVAHNRAGQPITGLRKEDFLIFEDGVERPANSFSRDELPLAVALVIDRSGSVASLMPQIQSAAFSALQQLKRDDVVCLFTFANDVVLLEKLTSDRKRVANRIGGIRASGGTRILDAVEETLRYLRGAAPGKRRAVILISDNAEGPSLNSADRVTRLALGSETVLYSIKVSPGDTAPLFGLPSVPAVPTGNSRNNPVPIVVKATGGEVFSADTSNLNGALATAVSRLKLRYTLGFDPVRTSPGRYHKIEVRLAESHGKPGADYTVLARQGYYE